MSETRRSALRILGTVSATCAFPFAGDELYGQHVHPAAPPQQGAAPYQPSFFTAGEFSLLARLTDVIIPPSDTPGAAAAGVPEYIDRVVSLNAEHQPLARAGLAWVAAQARERFSREYLSLEPAQHEALLAPLSEALDRAAREQQQARFRTTGTGRTYYVPVTDATPPARPAAAVKPQADDAQMPIRFFRLVKNLTADGYYTSRAGLVEELGYQGNRFLASFPECPIPEQ